MIAYKINLDLFFLEEIPQFFSLNLLLYIGNQKNILLLLPFFLLLLLYLLQ